MENASLYGGAYGGEMEANRTWVNFYCKDYGGVARLEARVYGRATPDAPETLALSVPVDDDQDGLADKWEIEMGRRWTAQYDLGMMGRAAAKEKFNNGFDSELADPDKEGTGPQGPLSPQAEEGDAHTVKEEYRGYILDGGGLDGAGANAFTGGHIRLDPARKEILLEVDRAAVLNNVPGNDLKPILNGASGVFSNATRGAGIYMYWLMDDLTLNIAKVDVDEVVEQLNQLGSTRNTVLKSDFLHLLIYDEGNLTAFQSSAGAYGAEDLPLAVKRGVVFATSDTNTFLPAAKYPKRDEAFSTVVAHEITHLLIPDGTIGTFPDGRVGVFNKAEHVENPNGDNTLGDAEDQTELMFQGGFRANRELGTVKIFPVVQAVLKTKTSEGLDQ